MLAALKRDLSKPAASPLKCVVSIDSGSSIRYDCGVKSANREAPADRIHTVRDTAVLASCSIVAGAVAAYIISFTGKSLFNYTVMALLVVPLVISTNVKSVPFICGLAFNLSLVGALFLRHADSERPWGVGLWESLFSMAILLALFGLFPAAMKRLDTQDK